ncbi:MAG: hypothetical protein EZS28_024570, partial [Streblomastix strix]
MQADLDQCGWQIKPEWLSACLAKLAPVPASLAAVVKCLIYTDIRAYGSGGLPQNVIQIERGLLQRPVVV